MVSDVKIQSISRWQLFLLAFRSMFFQSSWNYRQFQGLGWCVVLLPYLKMIHGPEKLIFVIKKYLKYFNTNTFLAPTVAGAVLSLEFDQAHERQVPMGADKFAVAVMAPVAAAGDALFWGGMRPLLCSLAVVLGVVGYWWSPLLLVVSFNVPIVVFRVVGAWAGYAQGMAVVNIIQRWHLADIAVVLKRLTVVVCGCLCAVLLHGGKLELVWGVVGSGVLLVTIFLAVGCMRKGVPVVIVLIGILASVTMVDKLLL